MKPNTTIIAFLHELVKRFALKSPKFFQVWQLVGMLAAFITGIPSLLEKFNIVLPEEIKVFADGTIAIAGAIMWIMAKLPVDNQTQVIQSTDKMPFTEAAKEKGTV